MKLIFALGNPESRYDATRHNVGFAIIDTIAAKQKLEWQDKPKFKAIVAEMVAATGEKVLLAKPTTFYNLVGESFRALSDFYKISPSDVLVVHDDLALPFGTVRIREGGSGGGSNGIKSLNTHGGMTTMRLRIGVGNELREYMDDAKFVLGKFSAKELEQLSQVQPKIADLIDDFVAGSLDASTHRHSV